MQSKISCLVILSFLLFQLSCSKEEEYAILPYGKLSDYEFFTGDLKDFTPHENVIPYDLNTPLFTDYAIKERFLYTGLTNEPASYMEDNVFDFPNGTILIKSFYFLDDFREVSSTKKILETRLLIKTGTGWEPASYLWNDEQTEAFFSVIGEVVSVSWIDLAGQSQSTNYIIPNKNDCKGCHSLNSEFVPIGPKANHLNKSFGYSDGAKNQLEKWEEIGFLANLPSLAQILKTPVWDDSTSGTLEERARAYLDMNCAHCHNPSGPADNSGLTLNYNETNPTALGICKPPVAAGQGSGGFQYGIVPGVPDSSIMIFRMESLEPDGAMPELGKTMVHQEGVALIREWIKSMAGNCD